MYKVLGINIFNNENNTFFYIYFLLLSHNITTDEVYIYIFDEWRLSGAAIRDIVVGFDFCF